MKVDHEHEWEVVTEGYPFGGPVTLKYLVCSVCKAVGYPSKDSPNDIVAIP